MSTHANQDGSQFTGLTTVTGGHSHQGNIINIHQTADQSLANRCLADLRVTDPRHDKERIQSTKGGLLADAYVWVLSNPDFCQWRDNEDQRLLWVKGDPGKGKTMLLCGIIDELEKPPVEGRHLAYFFCQATDERIRTATAVLRGLIFMLLSQDTSLMSHIKKYDTAGKALFEDANAWQALSEIFTNMLGDPKLQDVCLVVDALDECVDRLSQLLGLIVETSQLTRAKWLVSSRNWPEIEEQLSTVAQRLSLELNKDSVAVAVESYIKHKVKELAKKKAYSLKTKRHVHRYLSTHANGTFLWAALVCQELKTVPEFDARKRVKMFPSGLDSLYQRIIEQIGASNVYDRCHQFLALTATVYRPLSTLEYVSFLGDLNGLPSDTESEDTEWDDTDSERIIPEEPKLDMTKAIRELISFCGSFLTVREDTIYFVHQSAKDFLMTKQSNVLFPQTQAFIHDQIFSKSLEAMTQTLKRDMYGLQHPGFSIEDVSRQIPDPDPLAAIRYACIHWVNHFVDASKSPGTGDSVQDGRAIERFLQSKGLYWIEALSLLRSISEGMLALEKLKQHFQELSKASELEALVKDAYRLLQTFRPAIESWPLQTYTSALVLSPTKSLLRGLFQHERPRWFECRTALAEDWSACEQTLEGHTSYVNSAAFSADGQHAVSASHDQTVKVWNVQTGVCEKTFKGHTDWVSSAVFLTNRQRIVSASHDQTIKVWNVQTGACEQTLNGHKDSVRSAAFSTDGQRIVSASHDQTVKIWKVQTGACEQTLWGHTDCVSSAAFSADGQRVVSASHDQTVRVWNVQTDACEETDTCQKTLKGHTSLVTFAAFSTNGQRVVSASHDHTIRVWNVGTDAYEQMGTCEQALKGHTDSVRAAAFSADGQRVVSASHDQTVRVWNVQTGLIHAGASDICADKSVLINADTHCQESSRQQDYGLSPDRTWILKQSKEIVWLPPEYRPNASAVSTTEGGTNLALDCPSGRNYIFHLSHF